MTSSRPSASDPGAVGGIPTLSLIFGFGPMLPFVAGAIGSWLLPPPWPALSARLTVLWGVLILSFVAGVRRGFGFGRESASTVAEIGTMLVYFAIAGLALLAGSFGLPIPALALLLVGYLAVAALDAIGAHRGNAPSYFARLRPMQMAVAVISLAAVLVHVTAYSS